MKKIVVCMLMVCLLSLNLVCPVSANETLVIELDAGHGGEDAGAAAEWFGEQIYEKDINLTIANYLKEELETYENVKVKMTRTDDTFISLQKRTEKAKEDQADVLISLHNNASGEISDYDNGCTVLTAHGNARPDLAQKGNELASQILEELSSVGLENQGILQRTSETGNTYENGKLADYYHIVREGIEEGYIAIIIEHAFVDHGVDYKEYLRTDGALKRLALADAKGIARYYGLHKKGEQPLEVRTNVKEKITCVGTADGKQNQISYQVFFPDEEQEMDKKQEEKQSLVDTIKSIFKKFFEF
ncbi:MAG: N-acetylmuramoyl-L-alanine amidase [Lachnospiraceae bacterium]|nr:N-acetylmuramoyl-L-alanine amidase [Lachnospiraceae bacterium]